jgi:HAD superfamily hydrolase (TIGR01450 family)
VIFDLDGVIYRGHTPIPGAGDVTRWLSSNAYQVYYFTNNSTKTRESYVELLAGYDIATDTHHIVTSACLTARYFTENGLLPATALVVGEGGLAEELKRAGIRVVRRRGTRPVDYVVVGMDRQFTYRKLHEAQQAVLAGAKLIATNRDATYPVEGGNVIPGGGSIVAAVATAAEREPLLIGKPSPEAGRLIAHHADRLETDIEMGRRAGLLTCLVLTGISRIEEVDALPPSSRPHWVIESIAQVPDLLQGRISPRGDVQ